MKGGDGPSASPPPGGNYHQPPPYPQQPPLPHQQHYQQPPYPPGGQQQFPMQHHQQQPGYNMWQHGQQQPPPYGGQAPPHSQQWQHNQQQGMYRQPPSGAPALNGGPDRFGYRGPPSSQPQGRRQNAQPNAPQRPSSKGSNGASKPSNAPASGSHPQQFQAWGHPQQPQQQWTPQPQWGGAPPPPHVWQQGPHPPVTQPQPSPPPPAQPLQQQMYHGASQGGNQWPGGNNMTSPARQSRPRASPEVMGGGLMGPNGFQLQPGAQSGIAPDGLCKAVGVDAGSNTGAPDLGAYMNSQGVQEEDRKTTASGDKSLSRDDKVRGSYRCGRCGVPKKGHICPYQPKLKRRPDEPPPEMRNAAVQVEMDEFMTLRRLNLKIQGFPESYSNEPYFSDNMVVGEPRPPVPPVGVAAMATGGGTNPGIVGSEGSQGIPSTPMETDPVDSGEKESIDKKKKTSSPAKKISSSKKTSSPAPNEAAG